MRKRTLAALASMVLAAACATLPGGGTGDVELSVYGPPISPVGLPMAHIYEDFSLPESYEGGGIAEQNWSMLGREDLAADLPSADEYRANGCIPADPAVTGEDAVLDAIAAQARMSRVAIINESHYVTRSRDFSRKLLHRLRPLGYAVLAAETYSNFADGPDPVDSAAAQPWPLIAHGYYSAEPAFGMLTRDALALGYRLAAYEKIYDFVGPREEDPRRSIELREIAQAENLAALLARMGPDEKLIVHVGYSHAREAVVIEDDGYEAAWMAARLKALTGLDPLTISQTTCRGGSDAVRLAALPAGMDGYFDMVVDHPVTQFRDGRPAWRFGAGARAVPVPEELRPRDAPLVIEAFREGEPFDAVPQDRVLLRPGEALPLLLPAGRYTVRAVRLAEAQL